MENSKKKSDQEGIESEDITKYEQTALVSMANGTKEQQREYMSICYDNIDKTIREYCDLKEEYYPLINVWIMGTYMHRQFNSYPYLFFNAMKGSGKTRLLKLVASMSHNGKLVGSPSEAVLFRTACNSTFCIDEFESVGGKDKGALRELLNAAYKKGMFIERLKKVSTKGVESYVPEQFDVYCYDSKTQVLTNEGWKYFKDLNKKEKVMTINLNNNNIEYQKPFYYLEKEHSGNMVYFKSRGCDLFVTPEHNIIGYKANTSNYKSIEKYKLIKAKRVYEKINQYKHHDFFVPKTGIWKGKEQGYFNLPTIKKRSHKTKQLNKIPLNLWLQFMGWYLSEGCCFNKYHVVITQNPDRYQKEIIKLLKDMGLNPYLNSNKKDIRICSKQLYEYCKQFGKAHEKFIPSDLKNLSPNLLKILLKTLMKGDGDIKRQRYYTISKKLAEDVVEIAIKSGYGINYYKKTTKGKEGYLITIIHSKRTSISKTYKPSLKYYKGKVYCLSVPNQTILIKRQGKVIFCGNCPIAMANIWGMEEVLADRCLKTTLEKSNNPILTRLMETEGFNGELRNLLTPLSVVCVSVVCSENTIKWNDFLKTHFQEPTLKTLTYITTQTTQTTTQHNTTHYNNIEMYEKIIQSNIKGRALELFFPLFLIANGVSKLIFEDLLKLAVEMIKEKNQDDRDESKDVMLLEFLSNLRYSEMNQIPLLELNKGFLEHVETGDDWINPMWLGRALKRLSIVIEKVRHGDGRKVRINFKKVKEKLKMFKTEE